MAKGSKPVDIEKVVRRLNTPRKRSQQFDWETMKRDDRRRRYLQARAHRINKLMQGGFSRKQAKALVDTFAPMEHEHWDGRIGG